MSNFKRKRCRRVVRCVLCTPDRWRGNNKERFKPRDTMLKKRFEKGKE